MRHLPVVAQRAVAPFLFIAVPEAAKSHEAWLLTPDEIAALVMAPIPAVFESSLWLGLAAVIGFAVTAVALRFEPALEAIERVLLAPVAGYATMIGALVVRFGLGLLLLLAAMGGLPRHGTPPWIKPTFLVPDMQLALVPGWDVLITAQVVVAFCLFLGLFTRLAGLTVIGFAVLGTVVFGSAFLSYAPHFAAPGLMLLVMGGGAASLDQIVSTQQRDFQRETRQVLWRCAQILIGLGFIYLGVAYKLIQPTLLIAILEHGQMPTLGLPMPIIALVMTGVEIICGALLVMGRLVRPVSVAILGAITFLALVLGETPLFHANLYGAMLCLLLAGRSAPARTMPMSIQRRRVA